MWHHLRLRDENRTIERWDRIEIGVQWVGLRNFEQQEEHGEPIVPTITSPPFSSGGSRPWVTYRIPLLILWSNSFWKLPNQYLAEIMNTGFQRPSDPHSSSRSSIEEESEDSYDTAEKKGLLESHLPQQLKTKRWVSNLWFNVLFLFNVVLGLVLLAAVITNFVVKQEVCFEGPEPPYCEYSNHR